MSESLAEQIETLTGQINAISSKYSQLIEARRQLRLLAIREKFGVEVGGKVSSDRYGVCTITKIDETYWDYREGKPWIYGRLKKKDGSLRSNPSSIYTNWNPNK